MCVRVYLKVFLCVLVCLRMYCARIQKQPVYSVKQTFFKIGFILWPQRLNLSSSSVFTVIITIHRISFFKVHLLTWSYPLNHFECGKSINNSNISYKASLTMTLNGNNFLFSCRYYYHAVNTLVLDRI